MRAQCCICSDQFENDAAINIAAVSCGHTFHDECLMKWLQTSNTCPSCRTNVSRQKVIHRLYFDGGEVEGEQQDSSRLTNEIQDLRLQLLKKEKEKTEIEEEKKLLQKKQKDTEKKRKDLEKWHKEEQSINSSLTKQLQYFQEQQQAVTVEREECRKIKRKLIELQNVEAILTGTESETKDILSRTGDTDGGCKELARYCAMLKREYDQVKLEKKTFKTDLDKLRRTMITKDKLLQDKTEEVEMIREVYRKSEEDLKHVERERDILRKKVSRLKQSFKSPPAAASASFVETLAEESPLMRVTSSVTPNLFSNLNDSMEKNREIDLDESDSKIIEFCSPEVVKPSPITQNKEHCQENNIKYIRISSAAEKANPAKKVKRDVQDISNVPGIGNFNIFKKKTGLCDYSSNHRKGYDGLGTHTTFTQSKRKPVPKFSKTVSRVTSKTGKMQKMPALPSLDQYIDLS